MIIHIHSDNVDKVWHLMSPSLERALQKTTLHRMWDMDSALQAVKDGDLLGLYQPDTRFAALYSINHLPIGNNLMLFWAGKAGQSSQDWAEVDEYLDVVGKEFNCSTITVEGRKGWVKLLGPLDYKEDSVLLTREVSK